MTDASPSAAASAAAERFRRLAGIALHALIGWSAVVLPAAAAGASHSWVWGMAGALMLGGLRLAASRWPIARVASASSARCALVVGVAASFDFSIDPPDRLLGICSVDTSWIAQVQSMATHLGTLPASGAAMVGLVLLDFASPAPRARVLGAALAVCAMSMLMLAAMGALPWLARGLHWPWTADALVFSMISSMVVFHLLPMPTQWRKQECPYRESPA